MVSFFIFGRFDSMSFRNPELRSFAGNDCWGALKRQKNGKIDPKKGFTSSILHCVRPPTSFIIGRLGFSPLLTLENCYAPCNVAA